jgi:hypothetical protein
LAIIARRFSDEYFATVPRKGCHAVDTPEIESQDTPETESQTDRIGDDLLIGAIAIADELRVKPHQVNYIYKTRKYPIRKFGKQYIASKKKLRSAALAYTA